MCGANSRDLTRRSSGLAESLGPGGQRGPSLGPLARRFHRIRTALCVDSATACWSGLDDPLYSSFSQPDSTVKQPPRLVCSLVSVSPHVDDAALDGVRACGFAEVEIPIRTAGIVDRYGSVPWLTEESTPAQVAELRSRLETRELRPASCVCGAGNLWKPQEVERVRAKLRVAAALGAQVVTLAAGESAHDDDYGPICATLRMLAEEAQQLNLLPCVEYARGLAHNHRLQLQLLSDVGHPALKASFDPGLLHLLNDQVHAEVALAKSCHVVRHVRLRDFGGLPGVRHFPPLGRGGSIPFLRIYQLLRDIAYRGPWVVTLEGPPTEPELPLADLLSRLAESLAFLRRTGCLDRY